MLIDFFFVKSFLKIVLIIICDEVNVEGVLILDGLLVLVGVFGDLLLLLL